MISLSNLYNTDRTKRFLTRTCILQGYKTQNLIDQLIPPQLPGVVVADQAFAHDSSLQPLFAGKGSRDTRLFVVDREPETDVVDRCIASLPDKPAWFVALGGGSCIDATKALLAKVLFGEYSQIGYGRLRNIGDQALSPPRFVAVPTTAGSGSETSRYYLVSDPATGNKQVSRTWHVCPEIAILDADFLARAPDPLILWSAFDAFVHHWETLICRYERSPFVEMIALEGIALILASLDHAIRERERSALEALQRASALGGIAISNVRVGLLHTAGEALASMTPLPHGLTLMVFFEQVMRSYSELVANRVVEISYRLGSHLPLSIRTAEDLVDFWRERFAYAGLAARIGEALRDFPPDQTVLVETILADRVLVEKEHPKPLDADAVAAIVAASVGKAN